jgi:deoxycytidylate deaminase
MLMAPERPPADAIEWAKAAASQSGCQKSRRGVAIFGTQSHEVIANGTNHRPAGGLCSGSEACKATCRFICVHAEVMAIRRSLVVLARPTMKLSRDWHHLYGHDAVHVKIDASGEVVAAGGPSCLSCAREVLDIGLAGFWLYELDLHPDLEFGTCLLPTWHRYTAEEFFRLSLQNDRDLPR